MSNTKVTEGSRRFPLLLDQCDRERYPSSIPWSVIEPHEHQALRNHDQTLERLAERGGLGPDELLAVLTGKRFRDVGRLPSIEIYARLASLLLPDALSHQQQSQVEALVWRVAEAYGADRTCEACCKVIDNLDRTDPESYRCLIHGPEGVSR